jgi:hypothetical protein
MSIKMLAQHFARGFCLYLRRSVRWRVGRVTFRAMVKVFHRREACHQNYQ